MKYLIDDIWDNIRQEIDSNTDVLVIRKDKVNTILHEFEEIFEKHGNVDDLKDYFGFEIVVTEDLELDFELR